MFKSNKSSIVLNAFISTAALTASSFSALFALQNPQMLKYCYPGLAVVFGISSLGIATSFSNFKKIIFPSNQDEKPDNRGEAQETIELVKAPEKDITEKNNQTLDPDFVKAWKEASHTEKTDFVSNELFSPGQSRSHHRQFTHKRK